MVQGKSKIAGQASITGKSRPKGDASTKRKAKPVIVHHRDRTSAAINRRNEQLMAGRLAHEGGTLAVIPKPAAVTQYDSSRAATSVKQHKQLQQSNIARHARMKRDGMAVGERGKRDKKEAAGPAVGEKRKRGMEGVRQVGDEWFDERDAELEAMVYESEHSSDEEEDETKEGVEGEEEEEGDEEAEEAADAAEQQEETKESAATTATVAARKTAQSKVVNGTGDTQQPAAKEKKSAVKTPAAAAVAGADVEEGDDGARATKRAKALLGGWFAQRDSKR